MTADVREIRELIRRLPIDVANLIDHWALGLERGIPVGIVVSQMRQEAERLRKQSEAVK